MNIGVDAHILSGKFQGSRTYLINLYKNVLKLDENHSFYFFGHWNQNEVFGRNYNYVDYRSESRIRRLTYQSYKVLKNKDLNLFHSQYISPLLLPCNSLVTIHDILFESNPEYFSKSEVIRNKILVSHSARSAKQIHTVSNYSKRCIVDKYGIDPDKIKVVPNGVDLTKFNINNVSEAKDVIYKKFKIKDFLLTVGRIEPRKNHLGLIQAFYIIKQKLRNVGPLVIVGKPDFGYKDFYLKIEELNLLNDIVILEDIDDDLLPLIYKAAKLFIYPSFAEGFGIPPLEAMASGLPVVSSNKTAIPEVIENAGVLVDPTNIKDLASSIIRVLTDENLQKELTVKARLQSEKWSWENSAKAYLNAIQELS